MRVLSAVSLPPSLSLAAATTAPAPAAGGGGDGGPGASLSSSRSYTPLSSPPHSSPSALRSLRPSRIGFPSAIDGRRHGVSVDGRMGTAVRSTFPSSPALISSVSDLFEFICAGPLMKQLGFSAETVADSIDNWLATGVHLCQLFRLNELILSPAEKARIYHFYVPVYVWCEEQLMRHRAKFGEGDDIPPLVIGVSAPQGSGKTTLVFALDYLFRRSGRNSATLSIDDFYLTAEDQAKLRSQNPTNSLLEFRGNAGSHDLQFSIDTLTSLRNLTKKGLKMKLPRYDKSAYGGRGDRADPSTWPEVEGPLEVVLFEGWMLGFKPLPNEVVKGVDPQLEVVNENLKAYYDAWDKFVEAWIIIKIKDPSCVFQWRLQAEVAMREDGKPGMSDEEASLCVEGRQMLYKYCNEREIPHKKIGKLIVATSVAEIPRLQHLLRCGKENGVEDLRIMEGIQAMQIEPELQCIKALLSPSSGIVDTHSLMLSLVGEAEGYGTTFSYNTTVIGGHVEDNFLHLYICESDSLKYDENESPLSPQLVLIPQLVINSAGLGALPLAKKIRTVNKEIPPPAYYARGSYFTLSKTKIPPFSHLIYPIPEDGGLGVHVTLDLNGLVKFGPDVEWIDGLDDISCFSNRFDYSVSSDQSEKFYPEIRKYFPNLKNGYLEPGYSGIRPKLSGPGSPPMDFVIQGEDIHGVPGLVNLLGIESPGLTSSLAIAKHISSKYSQ